MIFVVAELTRDSAKQGIVRRSPAPLRPRVGIAFVPWVKRLYVVASENSVDVEDTGNSRKNARTFEIEDVPT